MERRARQGDGTQSIWQDEWSVGFSATEAPGRMKTKTAFLNLYNVVSLVILTTLVLSE